MATWTLKPKKDTTANWKASGRILEVNEWGVEETASGKYILRIGNGKDKFECELEHRRLSLLTIMGQQPNAHDIPRHLAKVKPKKGLC